MIDTAANPEPRDTETTWPPANDVLQKLMVVDLLSGKSASLAATAADHAAREPDSHVMDEPEPPRSEVAIPLMEEPAPARAEVARPAASPSAMTRQGHVRRSQWLLVAVAMLAVGEGVFIGSKLLRASPEAPRISAAVPAAVSSPAQVSVATTGTPAASAPVAEEHKPEALQVPEPQPTPRATGSLQVRSDPPGARVWIDGKPHGNAPVTAQGLAPGTHAVVLEAASGRIQQTVIVEAGAKATLLASVSEASGGIALTAPAELQVLEGGRLLGTSRAERILLETGRHTLDLVNESIGYQSRQVVEVTPGKITRIPVQFPDGTLNVNALPWAEVFVDGRRIGVTPIGNLVIAAGSHEVVFRHPEFGEVKRRIDVTLLTPARLSVDLQRKEK